MCVVASKYIYEHPEYDEAILGKPREEYIAWLMESNTWGGAIELAIFSEYFQTEIVSIDITSLRMDRFGSISHFLTGFIFDRRKLSVSQACLFGFQWGSL